jgi:UDP-N-acetylglucosamine 1-carboxyvinyltransferase
MGAVIDKTPSGLDITAPNGLHGTKFELPYPSVGATEQVLLAAVRAQGVTELRNAAVEPEIMDLICILQKMGAIIKVHTDRVIEIEGVERLSGYRHRPIPDRIEAGSWAAAALVTRGDVYVRGARQADMMTFLNVFRAIGGEFDISDGPDGGIRFWHPGDELRAVALETDVHPGFMTDWQQPMVVALTQARGLSIVHETVYERRLGYTTALNQMGATIQTYRECLGGTPCRFGRRNFLHSAVIAGPSKLHAADLVIPDLRGGFSHLIGALAAEGTSHVFGVSLINRGYEDFDAKLAALGARAERA